MKRLALGVAALLVVAAGSVASATPNRNGGESWCERHSDAKPPPEVARDRPANAGGGSRDGKVPNAFACYDASTRAADRDLETAAVVNAWADHEHGSLELNCVRAGASLCNQSVSVPAKVSASTPTPQVSGAPGSAPVRVAADNGPAPLVSAEVAGRPVTVDSALCVELDDSPICGENPGGR